VALPFALAPRESAAAAVRVTAPTVPGTYHLRVAVPHHRLAAEARDVEIREAPLPTSAQGPRLLAAEYRAGARAIACKPFESFLLPVEARNRGAALWLSRATHNRGEVRFTWRFVPDRGAPGPLHDGGRIRYDVLPGQTYRSELSVDAPGIPGRYALEVGLVSDGVTSFADVGTPPARLPVEVRRGD
jgi:hypothetical protein